MDNWICYFIRSLDSNNTYIGSTNNMERRLAFHNSGRGAKYTRGQKWIPVIIISGFESKRSCLSFEAGWKKLTKNRNNFKLYPINAMSGLNLRYYQKDTKWNRLMDLLYFLYNTTNIGFKFRINYDVRHPVNIPLSLNIIIFMEEWIMGLPWPHFINASLKN